MELTGSSRLQPRVRGKSYTLACQNPFAEMFREIRWLRKQNHAITGTEGKHSSSVCKCDTADLHAIHRAFDKMQNTLQNISIGVGQRGRGSGVCSALTLLPCKSTRGTKLHQTNNSITSLRTQMDEDTMYNLSLLWRLPSANEITDYIQTGETEAEVQCKQLQTEELQAKKFLCWTQGFITQNHI